MASIEVNVHVQTVCINSVTKVEGEPMLFDVPFSPSVDDSVALAMLKVLLEDHPRME